MKKRYWLFGGRNPKGGVSDFLNSFDTVSDLMVFVEVHKRTLVASNEWWYQAADTQKCLFWEFDCEWENKITVKPF